MKLQIRYINKDGEIGVLINGVKYIYYLDGGFIPQIEYLSKYKPGKALKMLKEVSRECIRERR